MLNKWTKASALFFHWMRSQRQCKKNVARESFAIIPIQHLLALKLGDRTLIFLTSVSSPKLYENQWISFKEGSPHEMFGKANFSSRNLPGSRRDQSHQHKANYKGTFDFCNIDQNWVNIQEHSFHILLVAGFNTRKYEARVWDLTSNGGLTIVMNDIWISKCFIT